MHVWPIRFMTRSKVKPGSNKPYEDPEDKRNIYAIQVHTRDGSNLLQSPCVLSATGPSHADCQCWKRCGRRHVVESGWTPLRLAASGRRSPAETRHRVERARTSGDRKATLLCNKDVLHLSRMQSARFQQQWTKRQQKPSMPRASS